MVLAYYNNLYAVNNVTPSGGAVVGGSALTTDDEIGGIGGGAGLGGSAVCQMIESHLGWKCKPYPIYIHDIYVEANSGFKKRVMHGRPRSKALVPSITICNQKLFQYFQ